MPRCKIDRIITKQIIHFIGIFTNFPTSIYRQCNFFSLINTLFTPVFHQKFQTSLISKYIVFSTLLTGLHERLLVVIYNWLLSIMFMQVYKKKKKKSYKNNYFMFKIFYHNYSIGLERKFCIGQLTVNSIIMHIVQ